MLLSSNSETVFDLLSFIEEIIDPRVENLWPIILVVPANDILSDSINNFPHEIPAAL